jgi:5-formyltetrahydrofolate cyclo-ligase
MSTMDTAEKTRLRTQVRTVLRALTPEQRAAFSRSLCEIASAQSQFQQARAILFFSALPDEPDLATLMHAAWAAGQLTALPRYDSATGQYSAAVVRSNDDLSSGRFGVLEPASNCPSISLNQLDLVFVPGVAFALNGARLGRGKGFYDRLLAEVRGHKCGVAFEEQIVAQVPEEPHDVRLNSLLTPAGWRPCLPAD